MTSVSDERPAPSAVGTLATRPLVHLFVYARNRRLTGRFELHAPDARSGSVDLWRGQVVDARTVPATAYFGAVAYELGHIDTATLDSSLLEISKTKRLHGDVLVARGALTPALRDQILVEQTCRKVHHLFSFPPETTFAFYDARPTVDEPAFTMDLVLPTWRALRESPPTESVREVLARYAASMLRISNEGPLMRAGLDADETAFCEALVRRPMTIAQLHTTSRLPRARVELLVYLLVITKCAEPATPSSELPSVTTRPSSGSTPPVSPSLGRPVSSPSMRPSIPGMSPATGRPASGTVESGIRQSLSFRLSSPPGGPRTASSELSKISAQLAPSFSPADLGALGVEHRASVIESEDPFTTLGLPRGASVDAVRASYFRLAKLWHPDRLPAELAPFRREVEKVFEHMTRAHRTLTETDARREYLATGKTASSASGPPDKRPRPEVIREIEQAIAKREFHLAESTARQLVTANAEDCEAQALAAWASTSAGDGAEETLRAALPLLDRAVNGDRHCERALFYRGVVHKRLGNSAGAFRDFARVVHLNPKHVDAQREVRIFEMRARKGSGEHVLDALISKVKKK